MLPLRGLRIRVWVGTDGAPVSPAGIYPELLDGKVLPVRRRLSHLPRDGPQSRRHVVIRALLRHDRCRNRRFLHLWS